MQGERVSFTGTLASMTHEAAHALVEEHGGVATPHVTRNMTMLVVGEEGWPLEVDGKPSQKLQRVNQWREEGLDLHVVTEADWLHLVGLQKQRDEARRLHTAAALSKLMNVSVGTIRRWARMGLIRPVRRIHRLLYFDFQEVSGARRIAELVDAGVPQEEIQAGLESLRRVLPDVERPLAQLQVLSSGSHFLYRDAGGLVQPQTGQKFFEFEPEALHDLTTLTLPTAEDSPVERTPEQWHREGCRLLDEGELTPAAEAFRLCLMEQHDPEVQFHLAEALYRLGNREGALERYYCAVEGDHSFIEAWTQLGCIHAELDQLESARDAFCIALDLHADYADAHFHLADILSRLEEPAAAADHWRTYLKFDSRGPWADIARQRLESSP